ncbi:MAG: serine hydrolase, partial [Woeseia sp.]
MKGWSIHGQRAREYREDNFMPCLTPTITPALRTIPIALGALLCVALLYASASAQVLDRPTYLSAAVPTSEELDEQRRNNSLALHAQLLCSGVFVSGRRAEDVIEKDLHWQAYYFHDWATTKWDIDYERSQVSVWSPATDRFRPSPRHVAVHTPTLGCALLPAGAERTAFQPVDAGTRLAPAAEMDWPLGDRNDRGRTANDTALSAALEFAFDDGALGVPQDTRALLIVHRGRIVAERYAPNYGPNMPLIGWSMGKSVAAILFGIFVGESGLDIDQPAPIVEWSAHADPRRHITPRHLLNMGAGLKFHNPNDDDTLYYTEMHDHETVYFRGQNTESLVLNQPLLYVPGEKFQYRNTNTLTLMSMIKRGNREAGRSHLSWPREVLFDRIGAR